MEIEGWSSVRHVVWRKLELTVILQEIERQFESIKLIAAPWCISDLLAKMCKLNLYVPDDERRWRRQI